MTGDSQAGHCRLISSLVKERSNDAASIFTAEESFLEESASGYGNAVEPVMQCLHTICTISSVAKHKLSMASMFV